MGEGDKPTMEIDTLQVHVVNYNENSYIRLGQGLWMSWYGESLESCHFEEDELEEEFQKQQ